MKKKCVMGRGRRLLLLFAKRVLCAGAAGCIMALFVSSFITVEGSEGIRRYFISPFSQKEQFENTDVFDDLLYKDVQNITRMAVIKSQLETDGVYDAKKKIDIAAYVNRTNPVAEETVTAQYYLDDLVRWGNYGFSYETVYGTKEEFDRFFALGMGAESVEEMSDLTAGDYSLQSELTRQAIKASVQAAGTDNLSMRILSEMPGSFEEYQKKVAEEEVAAKEKEQLEWEEAAAESVIGKVTEYAMDTDGMAAPSAESVGEAELVEITVNEAAGVQAEEEDTHADSEEEVYAVDILIPRYYSASGADLADYASSLDQYIKLRNMLVDAGMQLFHNFTEYSGYKNYYGEEKTNVRYCYQMMVDGEVRYFTNLSDDFANMDEQEIKELFSGFGRSLYYNPDRVEISTDTEITSEEMRGILGNYEYAFGENSRVWIGVDTAYRVSDGLAQARAAFVRFMPYYWQTAGVGVLAALMALWILVTLTVYEGRREAENEDGYVVALKKGDGFPTELVVAILLILSVLALIMGNAVLKFLAGYHYSMPDGMPDPLIMAAAVALGTYLTDWIGTTAYLSLVRRLKAHVFWRNTLIWKMGSALKRLFLRLYDNGHIVGRTLLPFLAVMAFNLCMGIVGPAGILVAGVADCCLAVLLYVERKELQSIVEGTQTIGSGDFSYKIDVERMHGENKTLGLAVNSIGDGIQEAVAKSMKDERLKADLITNVSHDIKTPLTSIINFVNLLKREKIQDEKIRGYIDVLDSKSQRLKQLTDDLVEASKISSGNISLQMERINFVELVNQTMGEFSEKLKERCLHLVASMPEKPVYIEADGRRIWRVVENLFGNVCKYALEGTRVYLALEEREDAAEKTVVFSMKNISAQPLNIDAEELTERFIRGDVSRSTEGSGLGLSIAKNLTQLQNGRFEIYLDGDLFKVILAFPCLEAAEGQS